MTTEIPQPTTIDIKAFLAMPKTTRPKVLLEAPVVLEFDDTVITLIVRQLSKRLYDDMTARVNILAPQVPTIDQPYPAAHRDPSNPRKIRPAGNYKEQNDQDPGYIREVQEWFTQSCIWLAVYSAVDSLGVDLSDITAIGSKQEELTDSIPGPSLLKLALAAAAVNPGLAIADELIRQQSQAQEVADAEAQLAKLTADLEAEYAQDEAGESTTVMADSSTVVVDTALAAPPAKRVRKPKAK